MGDIGSSALRVLYVDDDEDIREVAEISLRMDPSMDVRAAESGAQALAMLEPSAGWSPDAILLDVMMPGMDGPAVLAALRERPAFVDTPVIFVTARTLPAELEQLTARGARGVITKPFDPTTLAAQVRELLAAS